MLRSERPNGSRSGRSASTLPAPGCSFDRTGALAWIALTAVGLAVGLGVGVAIFDYGTSVGDLAVLGAVSGLGVGAAQWLVLRDHVGQRASSGSSGIAALWALGWTITTSIGVDVESKWASFGASGAITVTVLSGGLLWFLTRLGHTATETA